MDMFESGLIGSSWLNYAFQYSNNYWCVSQVHESSSAICLSNCPNLVLYTTRPGL